MKVTYGKLDHEARGTLQQGTQRRYRCYRTTNPRMIEVYSCISEPSNNYALHTIVARGKTTNGGEKDATIEGHVQPPSESSESERLLILK